MTTADAAISLVVPCLSARQFAYTFNARLDRVGTAAPLLDWYSMRHETQYTRLCRVVDRDARRRRGECPFLFTNLKSGQGLAEAAGFVRTVGGMEPRGGTHHGG